MPEAWIEVSGLNELARSASIAGAELRTELRAALAEAGEPVAQKAEQIARSKGLEESGKLIRQIGFRVVGLSAQTTKAALYIDDTAKRVSAKYPSGYNYPARYEFGDRDRPFLTPARDEELPEVEAIVAERINRLMSRSFEGETTT